MTSSKETFYFSHDYGARNDPKMIKLRIKLGMAGIGAYWVLIEYFYEQGGILMMQDIEEIADSLRCDLSLLKSVIFDYGLFKIDEKEFYSNSVLTRLDKRKEKSIKAKESVKKRWEKADKNTNVSKNHTNVSKIDTIKESKGKEIKEKEIKDTTTVVEFDVASIFLKSTTNYRLASEANKITPKEVDDFFKIFYESKIDVGDLNNKSKEDIVKHFNYWLPLFIKSTNNFNTNGKHNQKSNSGIKRSASTGPTPDDGYGQP